jgi:thioredoxin-like negative regulator of GroEL
MKRMPTTGARRPWPFSLLVILAAILWMAAGANGQELAVPQPPVAVHWYSSVEEASALAVPANQPIMIDFWADWCGACKVMEKDVYATSDFLKATERFLPVKIHFDKKTALARKYNVDALPMIVFADSYGNELFRYDGYVDAKSLLALVNALPADVTEFNRLNKILAADRNNFEALESMGKSLRTAGLYRASSGFYAKAAQRPEAKAKPEKRETILNEIGLNFIEVQDSKLAAESFEKCLKEFPKSRKKTEWTLRLGQAYAFGEKREKEKARKLLETFMRDHPSSPQSEQARKILTSL